MSSFLVTECSWLVVASCVTLQCFIIANITSGVPHLMAKLSHLVGQNLASSVTYQWTSLRYMSKAAVRNLFRPSVF